MVRREEWLCDVPVHFSDGLRRALALLGSIKIGCIRFFPDIIKHARELYYIRKTWSGSERGASLTMPVGLFTVIEASL
jgi:hypothetical protein